MKKIIALLLTLSMLFALTACGGNDKSTPTGESTGETMSTTESTNNTTDGTDDSTQGTTEGTTGSDTTDTTTPPATDAPHTHSYSSKVTTAATCSKEGIKTFTCSCGHSYTEKIAATGQHSWKDATCSTPKICKTCSATTGSVLDHNYIDGSCSYCQKAGGEVKITIDNWDKYFEIYEWVDWNLNAFGEPTEFFGIRCSFNIKSEYANKCSANIACEYLINQSHCDVTYDVQNKTYNITNRKDYYDEHLSTLSGGAYESYISFSLGDMGETTGTCTIAKYNFIKMTRIEGTITFY